MRKRAFAIIMLTALLITSHTVFASEDAQYERALTYYYQGRYGEVVTLLKEYIKENPAPSAYYLTGYALYELGKFDEATRYFEEAYLIDPLFSPEKIGFEERFHGQKRPGAAKKRQLSARAKVPGAATQKEAPPAAELPKAGEVQPTTQEPAAESAQGVNQPEPVPPPTPSAPPRPQKKTGPSSELPIGLMAGLAGLALAGLALLLYIRKKRQQ